MTEENKPPSPRQKGEAEAAKRYGDAEDRSTEKLDTYTRTWLQRRGWLD